MSIPKPAIYLRNKFTIKANHYPQFLDAKSVLLEKTKEKWTLIAACGQRSLLNGTRLSEPASPVMQIWRLENWESLYETIYEFSETGWYRELGSSLVGEQQELSVGVMGGDAVERAPDWGADDNPGYCYLFEEAFPKLGKTHAYLRGLNWLTAQLARKGWTRIWTASQITAAPSLISVLWKVPGGDIGVIDKTIGSIAEGGAGPGSNSDRYGQMMGTLQELSRESLYPMYTERLAERVAKRETLPPIKGLDATQNQS